MVHFTEEQLEELKTIFGLTRNDTLPVRDGCVHKESMVWWRCEKGPELVKAGDPPIGSTSDVIRRRTN